MKKIIVFLATCAALVAAEVKLAWDASPDQATEPTLRYRIYVGTQPGVYTANFDAGTNLFFTVTGLRPGPTNYFVATAYVGTAESDYSNEVNAKIKPGKPTSLRFTP